MRPRLLDLFSGAGGAAMGYHRAGFDVVGVDINPQPNYPFEFVQGHALVFLAHYGWLFDAFHASPPCQRYSAAAEIHDSSEDHPDMLPTTRDGVRRYGKPYVIENVERAPVETTLVLCGSMFGLGVKRHRLFESNVLMLGPSCGSHKTWHASVFGGRCLGRQRVTGAVGGSGRRTQTWDKFDDELATARAAMGIDWMTLPELSEAIPPAYTEWIGSQLMASSEVAA